MAFYKADIIKNVIARIPVVICALTARCFAHFSEYFHCIAAAYLLLNIPNKNEAMSIAIAKIKVMSNAGFDIIAITVPMTVQRIANQVFFSKYNR